MTVCLSSEAITWIQERGDVLIRAERDYSMGSTCFRKRASSAADEQGSKRVLMCISSSCVYVGDESLEGRVRLSSNKRRERFTYQEYILCTRSRTRIFIQQPRHQTSHVDGWVAISECWSRLSRNDIKQFVFVLDEIVRRYSVRHFNNGDTQRPHIDTLVVHFFPNKFWSHPFSQRFWVVDSNRGWKDFPYHLLVPKRSRFCRLIGADKPKSASK